MEHDEKAEELEREVADMEDRSDEVQSELDETKEDWESRQHDESVPGAVTEDAREVTAPEVDPKEGDADDG
jgi:hypothetical protein